MTLDMAKKGQRVKIVRIPDAQIRAQTIRFGILEGETVCCSETIPAGPVIIRKNTQEIALGRGLARMITVAEE